MRGRPGADWLLAVVAQPPDELLRSVVATGFTGLVIDRHGYQGEPATPEPALAALIGGAPLLSPDGRFAFYDLTEIAGSGLSAEARERGRHPLVVSWDRGCHDVEGVPPRSHRWCRHEAEIVVDNGASFARVATSSPPFFQTYA